MFITTGAAGEPILTLPEKARDEILYSYAQINAKVLIVIKFLFALPLAISNVMSLNLKGLSQKASEKRTIPE